MNCRRGVASVNGRLWRDQLDYRGAGAAVAGHCGGDRDRRRAAVPPCAAGARRRASNARLLELMPARPLVVRADRRIEADAQLSASSGSNDLPSDSGGPCRQRQRIAPEDLEALSGEIDAAQASAGRLSRKVRANGSGRVFEVRGGPAPGAEAAGNAAAVVLRHERRRGRAREARAAAAPDRRRAQLAHPPHRSRAVPDVVPRPRPQARPGQQRVRRTRSKAGTPPT